MNSFYFEHESHEFHECGYRECVPANIRVIREIRVQKHVICDIYIGYL